MKYLIHIYNLKVINNLKAASLSQSQNSLLAYDPTPSQLNKFHLYVFQIIECHVDLFITTFTRLQIYKRMKRFIFHSIINDLMTEMSRKMLNAGIPQKVYKLK